jgi:hypothetical protein
MSIAENIVMGLLKDKLKQVKVEEIVTFLEKEFSTELALLKTSDLDANGVADLEQVEKDFENAFKSIADAISVIEKLKPAAAAKS